LGVSGGSGDRSRRERGRGSGRVASGSSSSLRCQADRTRGWIQVKISCWALQRFATENPWVGLKRNKKRERRKAKLGHALTEFKFEFEISHTRFESLSKHSPEVSNMTKRSWPKFEIF
jgi:hypothetical protein